MILNQLFKQKEKKNLEIKEKTIVDYATFDIAQIASILADLISIYEKEKYIHYSVVDTRSNHSRNVLHMIVPNDIKEDLYSSKGLCSSFDTTGKALFLTYAANNNSANKNISFYLPYHEGVRPTINYGKFSYIKEFIDGVISYRMMNNIDEISTDMLNDLVKCFVSYHINEIVELQNKGFQDTNPSKTI